MDERVSASVSSPRPSPVPPLQDALECVQHRMYSVPVPVWPVHRDSPEAFASPGSSLSDSRSTVRSACLSPEETAGASPESPPCCCLNCQTFLTLLTIFVDYFSLQYLQYPCH